jgi:hypothetical protein
VSPPRLAARQAALYAAEAATIDGAGRHWPRLRDAQAYLDGLTGSDWFFERWPTFVRATIERRGQGSTWSTCKALDANGPGDTPTEGVILLAGQILAQSTVLHELAHLLVPPGIGHGPAFAKTLLALVRHEMGFFAFADLLDALRRIPGDEYRIDGEDDGDVEYAVRKADWETA